MFDSSGQVPLRQDASLDLSGIIDDCEGFLEAGRRPPAARRAARLPAKTASIRVGVNENKGKLYIRTRSI